MMHDPDPRVRMKHVAASALGGRRSKRLPVLGSAPISLATPDDIRRTLEALLGETLALVNTSSRNRAAAYLLGMATRLLETHDLAERIRALEDRLPAPELKAI
jgi:hypothetical protein